MDPVIVMEPAAPSLQLEFEEGPGTENNLDAVVFEKWGRNAIDVVVKVSSTMGFRNPHSPTVYTHD